MRLDFDETPQSAEGTVKTTAEERKMRRAKEAGMECVDETSNETDESSQREKDSDDETRNDKKSIQRLIKEVEKLVGEERRSGASKTFPPLILDDKKGITNNHRAKYARIKEWLKLNSVRGHDGRSASQVRCNYCYCYSAYCPRGGPCYSRKGVFRAGR